MKPFKKFIRENIILISILLILLIYMLYSLVISITGKYGTFEKEYEEVDFNQNYKYKDNEYHFGTISDEDIAKYYYKDFINILIADIDKSFEYVSDDAKLYLFNNNINKYKEEVSYYILDTKKDSEVKEYAYTKNNTSNILSVVDSDNLTIIFEEEAIWKYKVVYIGIK